MQTYRSRSGILKISFKKALIKDPWARIMPVDDVPTLVIHRTEASGVVTVRLVEKETEIRSLSKKKICTYNIIRCR
jgi:hypothetical protein